MTARAKVKLSILRDFAWRLWDPIGLAQNKTAPEDEYDAYLIEIVSQFVQGVPKPDIVQHLINIESEHMGLGQNATTRSRAQAVVNAIDSYMKGIAKHS